MNSSDASYNPLGNVPMETRIIPSVEVNAATDELVIRIPGAQLMSLKGQQAAVPDKKQPPAATDNIVVLIEEIHADGGRFTWLCDLSKCNESVAEHDMLMLAIMEAMGNNNENTSLDKGMLAMFGGASAATNSLHAEVPCYINCKVVLEET